LATWFLYIVVLSLPLHPRQQNKACQMTWNFMVGFILNIHCKFMTCWAVDMNSVVCHKMSKSQPMEFWKVSGWFSLVIKDVKHMVKILRWP
jgi:hypothetical protein